MLHAGAKVKLCCESGVKIGFHNLQQVPIADLNSEYPDINSYAAEISKSVKNLFPDLMPTPISGKWCIYTMNPDESFVFDHSIEYPQVFYANACSGHGFKFAPAVGQIMAEMGLGINLSVDLSSFSSSKYR